MSFPVRERGLKLKLVYVNRMLKFVVPRAGTWIETIRPIAGASAYWSFPVRERGLKQNSINRFLKNLIVVPRAGTWIETRIYSSLHIVKVVVPRAGTWIETIPSVPIIT